nr:CapA family protein [Shuttleworthia satelles]
MREYKESEEKRERGMGKGLRLGRNLILLLLTLVIILFFMFFYVRSILGQFLATHPDPGISNQEAPKEPEDDGRIRITASGDIIYHDSLIQGGKTQDGYDFSSNYASVKPLISSADLAIGDFEGVVTEQVKPAGYPNFNAPGQVVSAIKDAGFDVMDLANNHILDQGIHGALDTRQAFEDAGISTIGIKDDKDSILIREVKGIKVAILGFSYGYNNKNGAGKGVTAVQRQQYMQMLDENYVKEKIQTARQQADLVIVMPHKGTEYSEKVSRADQTLYHKMIDWGADLIFGGHPHVVQATEKVTRDGQDKFIIYSMGNFLSNQVKEVMGNDKSQRGTIIEAVLKKDASGQLMIEDVLSHPVWVQRTEKGAAADAAGNAASGKSGTDKSTGKKTAAKSKSAAKLYDIKTLLCTDYMEGGPNRDQVGDSEREAIKAAYEAVQKTVSADGEGSVWKNR